MFKETTDVTDNFVFVEFNRTDYMTTTLIRLDVEEAVNLTSYRYPSNTYADSKWVLTSVDSGEFLIRLVDVNIRTFGVSLTIGKGVEFEHQLLSFGSRDISIPENGSVVVQAGSIWIWFRVSDPATQTQLKTKNKRLEFETFASAFGVHFHVLRVRGSNGMNEFIVFFFFKYRDLSNKKIQKAVDDASETNLSG